MSLILHIIFTITQLSTLITQGGAALGDYLHYLPPPILPQVWHSTSGQRRPAFYSGTTWRIERWLPWWRVCRRCRRLKMSCWNAGWQFTWWTLHWRTETFGFTESWSTSAVSCLQQPRMSSQVCRGINQQDDSDVNVCMSISQPLYWFFSFFNSMVKALSELLTLYHKKCCVVYLVWSSRLKICCICLKSTIECSCTQFMRKYTGIVTPINCYSWQSNK